MLFISHIAGIYDDYLQQWAAEAGVEIEPDVLGQAGLAVARRVYDVMRKRDTPAIFIGGGARGLHHFTELVGGDLVVTINWTGTADRLIAENPAVVYRLFNPVPGHVVDELIEKVPDFRRAYLDDGLSPAEYGEFGGVEHFRHIFVSSWQRVEALADERRGALAQTGGPR
jgi:transaldolase